MVNPVGMSQYRRGREPPLIIGRMVQPQRVTGLLCRPAGAYILGVYLPRGYTPAYAVSPCGLTILHLPLGEGNVWGFFTGTYVPRLCCVAPLGLIYWGYISHGG